MRSNWQIWDFTRSHPQLIDIDKPGCYAFWAFDPYVERLLMQSIPHDLVGTFKTVLGPEITPAWIEENLNTITLFGETSSYKVLLSEDIPAKSRELLIEVSKGTQQTYLLLSFSKSSVFFDQLAGLDHWNCFRIEAPKFWEQGKLFNYLCHHFGVRLPYELQNFILENVDPVAGDYINCLANLKNHLGSQQNIDIENAKSLILSVRFDKFKLAKLLGQKKFADCFQVLLELDLDYSQLEDFLSFIPNYLLSLRDPSVIAKKGYKSKYDKEILSFAKLWTPCEIEHYIKLFGDLLIRTKRRDPLIRETLRQSYLAQF